jgi:VanZ family protein
MIAWLLVMAWMGFIFYLSHQPDLPSPPSGILNLLLKKAGHISVYAGLTALMWHALAREGVPRPWRFGLSLLFATLYGLSDEYHQSFIPGRNGRLTDVGIDALGAMLALILLRRLGARNWPTHHLDQSPPPGEPG